MALNQELDEAPISVTWLQPTATDNVMVANPLPPATSSPLVGLGNSSVFPVGVHMISYTFFDTSGNSRTCSFSVTIRG